MKNIIIVLTLFINITVFSQPYYKMILSSPTSTDTVIYYIQDTSTYTIQVGKMDLVMNFEIVESIPTYSDSIPAYSDSTTTTESNRVEFVQKGNLTDEHNKHKIYIISILLSIVILLIYILYIRNK